MRVSYDKMIGEKYDRVLVLRFCEPKNVNGVTWVEGLCDCGTTKKFRAASLRNGNTRSCGCLIKENSGRVTAKLLTTHGMVYSPEYIVWGAIKGRCMNPNDISYPNYGGRGIKICDEWRNSFEAFFASVGPKPFEGAQIERINNDKGYEPGNCKWVSRKENCRNRRSNKLITINGETKCLADWLDIYGIRNDQYQARVQRGIPEEVALKTPVKILGPRKGKK